MAWIGPLIGAGASIIGGAMNSGAQSATNDTQMAIARDNRNWMSDMSNTAEQRHVADLRQAGLNPALAYSTPAPVPGTPNQPSLTAPQPGNGLINSAGALAQMSVQRAQVDNLNAQADKTRADTAQSMASLPYTGETAKQNLENMKFQSRVIWNSAANLEQEYASKGVSLEMANRDSNFQEKFLQLRQNIAALDVQRARLGMPRLENDASWQQAHPTLSGWLQSGAVDSGINAAGKAIDLLPMGSVKQFLSGSGRNLGTVTTRRAPFIGGGY